MKGNSMSLEDIKREWRNEMDRSISSSELQDLLNVVQRRCAGMERSIHGRDVREILAAVFVVGAFAAMWPLYRSSPVAILGVVIIFLGAALIIYVLMSARKPEPLSFHASVLDFSRNRLAWLDSQIRLLRTVVWWYVAPLCVGCLLLTWGIAGGAWLVFGLQTLITLAVAAGIVVLNQWTVRRSLQPVRNDLARVIEALEITDQKQ
jgi:hypothetical protein